MPTSPPGSALHARIKSDLRLLLPRSVSSAHLTEAIAAGLGHGSHAALLAAPAASIPSDFAEVAFARLLVLSPALRASGRDGLAADVRTAMGRVGAAAEPDGQGSEARRTNRPTLNRMLDTGGISATHDRFLRQALAQRCRIVVTGPTCSGKTTLVNMLADLVPLLDPVLIVEHGREIATDPGRSASSTPPVRWEGNLQTLPLSLPEDDAVPERGWLVMPEVGRMEVGRWALRAASRTGGALLATQFNLSRNREPWKPAFCLLRKVAAWSMGVQNLAEDFPEVIGPPPIDVIVCLQGDALSRGGSFVDECWTVDRSWNTWRVA